VTSYFASGTGAAGLVGAFLWWELRSLGVRLGVGLSSVRLIFFVYLVDKQAAYQVLPFVIPLTYFLLLPRPDVFSILVLPDIEDAAPPLSEYTQLPVSEEDAEEAVAETAQLKVKALNVKEKWELLKPMLPRFMLPLCKPPLTY
jgi:battenin